MTKSKVMKVDLLSLMAAICVEICDQQGGNVPTDPRLINACIDAANLIKKEIDGIEYVPVKG